MMNKMIGRIEDMNTEFEIPNISTLTSYTDLNANLVYYRSAS